MCKNISKAHFLLDKYLLVESHCKLLVEGIFFLSIKVVILIFICDFIIIVFNFFWDTIALRHCQNFLYTIKVKLCWREILIISILSHVFITYNMIWRKTARTVFFQVILIIFICNSSIYVVCYLVRGCYFQFFNDAT